MGTFIIFLLAMIIAVAMILRYLFHGLKTDSAMHFREKAATFQPQQSPTYAGHIVPHTRELMYPAPLIRFRELADKGHIDNRALVYMIVQFDIYGKNFFYTKKLRSGDFGGAEKSREILLDKGLIREPHQSTLLAARYTNDELRSFLSEQGLKTNGRKHVLVKRLVDSGFQTDMSSFCHELFEITESGIAAIREYLSDERVAYHNAISALKAENYTEAIHAYQDFDKKWGFVHTSGKEHTIFANYNVSYSRLEFIANYPMPELNNSENFKSTLRACILAGMMSKRKDRGAIADFLESECNEQIQCPNILDHYRDSDTESERFRKEEIYAAMQRYIDADNRYVLEYYIAHVKYLSHPHDLNFGLCADFYTR